MPRELVDGTAGLERSGLFLNLNAGKKGLALDMSTPEAREVLLDLVRWADLLCESFSPRAMKAWGLSYETLREVNPKLVMLSSCLMGQTGPLAMFAGFGNLAAAISGFYHITGWPDRDPSGPFSAYTDYYAPRVTVPVVLAAVDHARRTGEGAYLDYSQGEAAIHVLAPALLDYQLSGNILGRHGNRDPYFAPHGVFPCSGVDRWIAIAITNDAQWSALATQLGREDLSNLTADDRLGRVEELEAMLSAWTAPQEPNDVETRLQNVAIPAYVVQNSPEAMVDTQLAHREHFVKVDHTELGSVLIEGSRYRFSDTPATHFDAAPTLGEHTFEILTDILGYDVERVADLAAAELLE